MSSIPSAELVSELSTQTSINRSYPTIEAPSYVGYRQFLDISKEAYALDLISIQSLYGYLHYHQHLSDGDHGQVIAEHERFERRPLTKFFQEAYSEAMRCKLMASGVGIAEAGEDVSSSGDAV